MAATLDVQPWPGLDDAAIVVLDCKHGTTRIGYANAENSIRIDHEVAIKMALARHYAERRCRCIRFLWRRHMGAELGELVLARGAPQ